MTSSGSPFDGDLVQSTEDATQATDQLRIAQSALDNQIGMLIPGVSGLADSLVGLKIAAIAVAGVIAFKLIKGLFESGREARQLSTNYILLGLSVDETRRRMERLQEVAGRDLIKTLGDVSGETLEVLDVLGPDAAAALEDLAAEVAEVSPEFESAAQVLDQVFTPALDGVIESGGSVEEALDAAKTKMEDIIAAANNADQPMSAWREATDALGEAWSRLKEAFGPIGDFMREVLTGIAASAVSALTFLVNFIAFVIEDVRATWEFWSEALETFLEWATGVREAVIEWAEGVLESVQEWAENVWNAIKEWSTNTFKSFVEWITNTSKTVGAFLKTLFEMFRDRLMELAQAAFGWGANIMQGLWNGLKSVASRVQRWVEDFVQRMIERIKSVLRMGSPSRVMMEIGEMMGEGLRLGMEASMPEFPGLSGRSATHQTIYINNSIGGRGLGSTILDVVDGQVRRRIPNIGLS